jgi:glyoxalase family protein
MRKPIVGLHHVTAIASDPQRNLDFYTGVLGLRFVKRTVNFDDPGTYHFYFGDDTGSPGTILTFFPWPGVGRGKPGAGEVAATTFSVSPASLPFWQQRLKEHNVQMERIESRFGGDVLAFQDPDGMQIEIIGQANTVPSNAPRFSSIPHEHSVRGFFGVTLLERDSHETSAILEMMGYQKIGEKGNRLRFSAAQGTRAHHIDLLIDPHAHHNRMAAGSVHHIAFRAEDDVSQIEWRAEIAKHLDVTPVLDRTYFQSIYFREPGGVLFELATDPPGFLLDEPVESLGEALRLPEWLEPERTVIEKHLPQIELHKEKVLA